jgi:DNA-binding NarL/FixJ family response regulator
MRQRRVPHLTLRELTVLRLIAAGKENSAIASELAIRIGTVKNHIGKILIKLNIAEHAPTHARRQAVAVARQKGLIL